MEQSWVGSGELHGIMGTGGFLGMETGIAYSCGDRNKCCGTAEGMQKSGNEDAFYCNAVIAVPPVAKKESNQQNYFQIPFPRQREIVRQVRYSGTVSDTHSLFPFWQPAILG